MGQVWVYDGTQWRKTVPLRSNGVAHDPVFSVHRRSGSSWQEIWSRPVHPPTAPVVSARPHVSENKFVAQVTTAANANRRITKAVVKVGVNKIPQSPTENDGTYYATKVRLTSGKLQDWSAWWDELATIPDGSSREREFPVPGIASLPYNTPVHIAAWVQDENFVWSPAGRHSFTTRKADPTPPTIVVPPNRKRQPDLVYSSNWWRTWSASGGRLSNLAQGVSPTNPGWGIRRSMIGFPEMTHALRGSLIQSIEVFLVPISFANSQAGIASFGYHNAAQTAPSNFTQVASQQFTHRFDQKNVGQWVMLPQNAYERFSTGFYRGINLYRNSHDLLYSVAFDPALIKIRVRYYK